MSGRLRRADLDRGARGQHLPVAQQRLPAEVGNETMRVGQECRENQTVEVAAMVGDPDMGGESGIILTLYRQGKAPQAKQQSGWTLHQPPRMRAIEQRGAEDGHWRSDQQEARARKYAVCDAAAAPGGRLLRRPHALEREPPDLVYRTGWAAPARPAAAPRRDR